MSRRRLPSPGDLFRDGRYAVRGLRRSPGFVAVAVTCLGVGLGIATSVFAMLDAVVKPHVPYHQPERVFDVYMQGDGAARTVRRSQLYAALLDAAPLFESVTGVEMSGIALLETPDALVEARIATVGPDYFRVFGMRPRLGRAFQPGDAEASAAIVTHDVWDAHFQGRHLEDARFTVDGRVFHVVGVLPRGVHHPIGSGALFYRDDVGTAAARLESWVWPYVRLKSAGDSAVVMARLGAIADWLTSIHGTGRNPFRFRLANVRPDPFQLREIHAALAGGGVAVLLIACANLANLMLARGLRRRRELVVQVAVGATRPVIVRQLVAEALLVSIAGAVLGLLLTLWGAHVLRAGIPGTLRWAGVLQPQVSWRLFVFGLLAALASTVVFGLAPALQASDVGASEALKDSAGTTTGRTRHAYSSIVIAEVALTLVLLVGASLLVRSIAVIKAIDYGSASRGLISGHVGVWADSAGRWRRATPSATRLMEVARQVPGVVDVALEQQAAPWGVFMLAEQPTGRPTELIIPGYARVSTEYLRVRGLRLIAGRDFSPGDAGGAGVVILDSVTARRLWGGAPALGRLVKLNRGYRQTPWLPVVGIVAPPVHFNPDDPVTLPKPTILLSTGTDQPWQQLLVRTSQSEARVAAGLLHAMRTELSGGRVWARFWPWVQEFEDFLNARRFIGRIFGAFGLLALALAATGLYAVIAQAVSRRLREFAIRVALGAEPRDIVRLSVRDAAVMVLAGTGIGAFVGLWAGRYVDPWLYGVYFVDAPSLIIAEAVLLGAAALACAAPVRRAMRADPVEILRAT